MKVIKNIGCSDLLGEVVERLQTDKPRSFVLIYVDPKTNLITVAADGVNKRDQLGMLEIGKDLLKDSYNYDE